MASIASAGFDQLMRKQTFSDLQLRPSTDVIPGLSVKQADLLRRWQGPALAKE